MLGNHGRHQLHLDMHHYFARLTAKMTVLKADECDGGP